MDLQTTPAPDPAAPLRHRRYYLLAVTVLMAVLLWTLAAEDAWRWLLPSRVGVQIEDQVYLVPERRLERLSRTQPSWLSTAEQQGVGRLEQILHHELDLLFTQVHGRVPGFADWYYSLTGTGVRLWSAMPWSDHNISERLFPEAEWGEQLDRLDEDVREMYGAEIVGMQARWLDWLADELAPYRRDRSLPAEQETIDVTANLRAELAQRFDGTGLAIALGTGTVAGTLVSRQAIARVNARAAAARASARLAGRSTATGSSAVCGATGPIALGCAALVFTGITLGTEWVILKGDEALNRPELEEALHSSIDALRLELMEEYNDQLLAALHENIRDLTESMQASVRPIDSLRSSP